MFVPYFKKNWLSLVSCLASLVVALFWLALRVCWAGISKVLGADTNPTFFAMNLPLLICIFLWLAFVYSIVMLFLFPHKRVHKIVSLGISLVFVVISIVIVNMGAADYMQFIMPKFWLSLAISMLIACFALLLFFVTTAKTKRVVASKCALLVVVVLATVLAGFNIQIYSLTNSAVVYAVEDNYQIVFSTSTSSIAWVEVGGQAYYELYAGSMKSSDIVHKVEVPQAALDRAKSYTIYAQQMIYRGPFGGYKGRIVSENYTFRPVDTSDGLQYYSMSDVHSAVKGATNAASHYSDMDFVVIAGDIVSMVESHEDANLVNVLAHNVTRGQFPVIYARGNHEVKGAYAEYLHKYVGSKNEDFYYTVEMNDVFAIVLDIGEDHEDDWWEYYDTAQFDIYRSEQTEFLKDIRNADLSAFKYKLAVCHIPVVFVNNRKDHESFKNAWTEILNDLDIDMLISGHQHTLYPLVATAEARALIAPKTDLTYNPAYTSTKTYKGYLTDANFHNILVSRRSDGQLDQAETLGLSKFIGLYTNVSFLQGKQTSSYTNANGDKVAIVHPFANIDFGVDIVTEIRTK